MQLNNRGTSIIFAVFALLVLSILGIAISNLVSTDAPSQAGQILSSQSFFAAESGWQIGARAVKNDKDATDGTNTSLPQNNGYCRISYMDGGFGNSYEGYPASGPAPSRVSNPDRVVLHGSNWNDAAPSYAIIKTQIGSYIAIWDFQQRINLIGAKLLQARIVIKVQKSSAGGTNPQIRLQYSIDGGTTWYPDPANGDSTAGYEFTIDNDTWPSSVSSYRFSPNLPNASWQNIMNNNGSNFRIRVLRLNAGDREVWIDWLALEIVTEVDAMTEPWSNNSYITLPASLTNSSIESITVNDESGKVNINYAPQNLIRQLFTYCGIPDATSNTLATNIVNYRTGNWFDTIEEVKQVSGMTEAYFDLIDQDITVYSWINQDVTLPLESRAPININTASRNVLSAIIKCSDPGSEARVNQLVDAIISQRANLPFANMYSSYETQEINGQRDLESFSGFLQSLGYGWLTERRNRVMLRILNIADASRYNMDITSNWAANDAAGGTEFCYYSHTFLIESKGRSGNIERAIRETYGNTYDYTIFTVNPNPRLALPAYIGQTNPRPYWREEQ